jgi:hypothetical protein
MPSLARLTSSIRDMGMRPSDAPESRLGIPVALWEAQQPIKRLQKPAGSIQLKRRDRESPRQQRGKSVTRAIAGIRLHWLGYGMENTMLNRRAVNLTVVALLTLLFAGCAVAPSAENLSVPTTGLHMRTGGPDDLQSNPSDSPGFNEWGGYGR